MGKHSGLFEEARVYDPTKQAASLLQKTIHEKDLAEDVVILDESLHEQVVSENVEPEAVEMDGATQSEGAEESEPIAVTAEEARTAKPVLEYVSDRTAARLLIVTRDATIRELGSLSQRHMLELGALFAEIHVIMMNERDDEEITTVRLAQNIWLYSTHSRFWWTTVFGARRIAYEQLVFGGSFRPDIIVADDPFESGIAAWWIARTFARPFQVHVREDFYDKLFVITDRHNDVRGLVAPMVIKRATSIRVTAPHLLEEILHDNPKMKDHAELLPAYFNLRAWRDMTPTISLKMRYPQFRFIMLHISTMLSKSSTAEVIAGAAPILQQYPTVGLVIVGSGSLRSAVEKQVIALGIQYQVEFEPTPEEHISHMKSANVLVHLSLEQEEDVVLLEAASVKLPIIARKGGLAEVLFTDGESAFLTEDADPLSVAHKINMCLNENQSRVRYALAAQEIVFDRIEQDYRAYLEAYRNSIERTLA